jgi:hypothetical protein
MSLSELLDKELFLHVLSYLTGIEMAYTASTSYAYAQVVVGDKWVWFQALKNEVHSAGILCDIDRSLTHTPDSAELVKLYRHYAAVLSKQELRWLTAKVGESTCEISTLILALVCLHAFF